MFDSADHIHHKTSGTSINGGNLDSIYRTLATPHFDFQINVILKTIHTVDVDGEITFSYLLFQCQEVIKYLNHASAEERI